MIFPLYELNDEDFELLVISICEEILWIGTINFSTWRDWWRDWKFTWKANNFPSKEWPLDWKIIIQSKHTKKINASCSDSDFDKLLDKEIPKIKKLKEEWFIDYYIIFTNRKLTGGKSDEYEKKVTKLTWWVKTFLIAEEKIQKFLNDYPLISKKHNLTSLLLPLEFYEEDLVELIKIFSEIKFDNDEIKNELQNIDKKIKKIDIELKNEINNLTKDYYENVLKKSYNFFNKIQLFLKDTKNEEYADMYEDTILDINEQIILKRDDYLKFDEILAYLTNYVEFKVKYFKKRRYIRFFLHYMYYNCDIGKS